MDVVSNVYVGSCNRGNCIERGTKAFVQEWEVFVYVCAMHRLIEREDDSVEKGKGWCRVGRVDLEWGRVDVVKQLPCVLSSGCQRCPACPTETPGLWGSYDSSCLGCWVPN